VLEVIKNKDMAVETLIAPDITNLPGNLLPADEQLLHPKTLTEQYAELIINGDAMQDTNS